MLALTPFEQGQLFTADEILQNLKKIFDETKRLIILLDTTLDPKIFDQIKADVGDKHIIYIPLAKGQKTDNTAVFFIEIKEQVVLDKVSAELVGKISQHFNQDNNEYYVCGFGSSKLDNEKLNKIFKKTLVLKDDSSEFIFRWYDPRVLIYLDDIFTEYELNSLLGLFDHWQFIHPIGYLEWKKNNLEKFIKKNIYKLSTQQSLALDFIEISNLVFKEAINYPEIDLYFTQPKNILKNIYYAYEQYDIENYTDLFSYGLYCEILGSQFFIHPDVQSILTQFWKVEPNKYSFTEAMAFLEKKDWMAIQQDLKILESKMHG